MARIVARNVKNSDLEVNSILVPESLRGYILVESSGKLDMQNPSFKVPHMKGAVEGEIPYEEVKSFLNPEPIISSRANTGFSTKRKYCRAHIWSF